MKGTCFEGPKQYSKIIRFQLNGWKHEMSVDASSFMLSFIALFSSDMRCSKSEKKVNKSHHHFQLKKQRNLGICKFKTNAWECTANSTYQFISCSRLWVKKFIIYFYTDTISWLQLNLTVGLTFWKNDKHCGTFEMPGCEQCFCLQVILPYLAITVSSINLSLPGYIFPTFKNLFALKVVSSKASASPEGRCKGCMHQDWDA